MHVGEAQITSGKTKNKRNLTVEAKERTEKERRERERESCPTKGGCTSSVPLGDMRPEGKPTTPELRGQLGFCT